VTSRRTKNICAVVLLLTLCCDAAAHPPYVAPSGPLSILGVVALFTVAGWLMFGGAKSKLVKSLLIVLTFAAVVVAGLCLATVVIFS
jgi:hypothetical protein